MNAPALPIINDLRVCVPGVGLVPSTASKVSQGRERLLTNHKQLEEEEPLSSVRSTQLAHKVSPTPHKRHDRGGLSRVVVSSEAIYCQLVRR
jgi:hypothetical protein